VSRLRSQETRRISFEGDALRMSMDWSEQDLGKPQVLIESTWGYSHPCSFQLDQLVAEVEKGVLEEGGKAGVYTATDICDGVAQGHKGMQYSLLHRELLAAMTEVHAIATPYDAAVLLSAGDKAVPGHLMAMARMGIPAIHVPGGAMGAGPSMRTNDELWHMSVEVHEGKLSETAFTQFQRAVCPTCGACQYMGTAATMQVMAEALGLALPGSALVPATLAEIRRRARAAGRQVLRLLEAGLTPRAILTPKAFENAMVVHAAVNGSLNAVMHLPAIAAEVGIRITPEQFDAVHRRTPVLVDAKTAGRFPTELFWYAGGVPAVMDQLRDHLHLDVLTVTGKTLGENLDNWRADPFRPYMEMFLENYHLKPEEVIRPVTRPLKPAGGLAVLSGNLAPGGAVIKATACVPQMHKFVGRARVFEGEQEAVRAIAGRQIQPGDCVVIRYQGPRACGMPEMFFASELIGSDPELSTSVALLTDGRYSGATKGPAVGYVEPEALDGGPIALVEEGDLIRIDIPGRRLELAGVNGELLTPEAVSAVLELRRAAWRPPQLPRARGALGVYRRLAGGALRGATMEEE
jgi:dihydroxy-acid dehydratase